MTEQAKVSMGKTVDLLKNQLSGIGSNIDENLMSSIKVENCGQKTPLNKLALISEASRRVSIVPYDLTTIDSILEQLKQQNFDVYKFSKTTIIVNIPLPSGDSLRGVIVQVDKLGEAAKIAIRNIRKKFRKKNRDNDKGLQTITDLFVDEINCVVGLTKKKLKG